MTITLRGLAVIAALALSAPFPAAATKDNEGVCQGEHMHDATGPTHTYTAPEGFLISGYCVKAGSINNGNGPEYHTVTPPAASITFGHSSGKDISHYSVTLVPVPPVVTETPTPTPTPTPTETPTPTPTETPSTPTPTLPVPTLPTPTVTETVSPPTVTATPTPTASSSTPTESPTKEPTKTPTKEPEVSSQVKTEHVYTCTSHTAIRYHQTGSGPWVEISREVETFPNTCDEGQTFEQSVREEGL